jgi:DNA-directed RNA polymerase specialized sigma24 family protein
MSTREDSGGPEGADEDLDPEDGDEGAHRPADEVRAGLNALTSPELARIVRIGRNRARGTELTGEDLLHTVVERLLEGRRHWRIDETLVQCLARTMKSLARDWWRRQERVSIKSEAALGETDANVMAAVVDDAPGVERAIIARQELDEIEALLKDDKNTLEIAQFLAEGEKPAEIREALGLTQTQYDATLKRIVRARKKIHKAGEGR